MIKVPRSTRFAKAEQVYKAPFKSPPRVTKIITQEPQKVVTPKQPELYKEKPKAIAETTRQPPDEWSVPRDGRPTFSLNSNQVPEIKDWKVGEKYVLELTVEQLSSQNIQSPRGDTIVARFVVTHYTVEKEGEDAITNTGGYGN